MPKPAERYAMEDTASVLQRLKNDESGMFIPTPKSVVAGIVGIAMAGTFLHGFLDGMGFKITNEKVIAEGSEMNVKLKKIIPAPKLELLTAIYEVDGAYATELYKSIGIGQFKKEFPMPGMLDRTEFRNGVPIMVDVEGKDLNTFKFIEKEIDVVTGKPYIDALVDLPNLRFQASIAEGVAVTTDVNEESDGTEEQKRPLIVDSDNATAELIKNELQKSSLIAQAGCEMLGGSKESCDVLDIFHIQEYVEIQNAINNSDARRAAMESANKCTGEFWDKILPVLEKALTDYIASFYDMSPEEASRLVKIQYTGGKPDFSKSMISDYLKDGTLTDFATKYSYDLKVSNDLQTTCSADGVELELVKQPGTNALEAMGENSVDNELAEPSNVSGDSLS